MKYEQNHFWKELLCALQICVCVLVSCLVCVCVCVQTHAQLKGDIGYKHFFTCGYQDHCRTLLLFHGLRSAQTSFASLGSNECRSLFALIELWRAISKPCRAYLSVPEVLGPSSTSR